MASNRELLEHGFDILRGVMAEYIAEKLMGAYGADWWSEAVLTKVPHSEELPKSGTRDQLLIRLDIRRLFSLFKTYWHDLFSSMLVFDCRDKASSLWTICNKLKHIGGEDFEYYETIHSLYMMKELCAAIDQKSADKISELMTNLKDRDIQAMNANIINNNLQSWRSVITPHPDVSAGRYNNAEFAADLSQVADGSGSIEYLDPAEFFMRTYITGGLKELLVKALRRLSGLGGEPVMQLRTSFGGGKTHSMLALYHLMRGRFNIKQIKELADILSAAGIEAIPKVNIAVFDGTKDNPAEAHSLEALGDNIKIHTVWGSIAAQLAVSANNPELYNYVMKADEAGISPGKDILRNLFDACGPCLILLDELAAYAVKLPYDSKSLGVKLPGGTYENFAVFVQEITEAARLSKNSMVVASLLASANEYGSDKGKQAVTMLEQRFGRLEAACKPVEAAEGFEVVRRRLFLDCQNDQAREQTAKKFVDMYANNANDFPVETKDSQYKQRIVSCYPIHPELFDRLYNDWSTLKDFQRTRGVLKLMAALIHELWLIGDSSQLIMPGAMIFANNIIREQLIRNLEGHDAWNAVIDNEIDGENSLSYKLDKHTPHFGGKTAARRVSRTVMLGSAPGGALGSSGASDPVRGIDIKRIRLGAVQPGETISDFNDALNELQNASSYLYRDGTRFWYDMRPTLRKTAADRAKGKSDFDADIEIKKLLNNIKCAAPFAALHKLSAASLTSASQDVPDTQALRLVIMAPDCAFDASSRDLNAALNSCQAVLAHRGSAERIYKNMLVFIAPDKAKLEDLRSEVKLYLAWQSIDRDKELLNLGAAQVREAAAQIRNYSSSVNNKLLDTWSWLILPSCDISDLKKINFNFKKLAGQDNIIARVQEAMRSDGAVVPKWNAVLLNNHLDKFYKAQEDISIAVLWDNLCKYCYNPRLTGSEVLIAAVKDGLTGKYFALAAGKTQTGEYINLSYDTQQPVSLESFIVKRETADRLLNEPEPDKPDKPIIKPIEPDIKPDNKPKVSKHFELSADLDASSVNKSVKEISEYIISQLAAIPDSALNIKLEIDMTAPNGLPSHTVRALAENCRTLKIKEFKIN